LHPSAVAVKPHVKRDATFFSAWVTEFRAERKQSSAIEQYGSNRRPGRLSLAELILSDYLLHLQLFTGDSRPGVQVEFKA
jgi:hypothetical protein